MIADSMIYDIDDIIYVCVCVCVCVCVPLNKWQMLWDVLTSDAEGYTR
jgi:hypothetical protein